MSEELQRNQPCGCVVCVCEDGEQCHGCGAKSCGAHPAGEIPNPVHIPMMYTPPPDAQAMTHKKLCEELFIMGHPYGVEEWCVLATDYDALAARLAAAEELNRVAALGMSELEQRLAEAQQKVRELEVTKDGAYLERNHLVAALARCFPSGIRKTAIEGWSGDWHGCVYIDLPAGQISYHYHDSQAFLFEALPAYTKLYDGHTKEDVHERLKSAILQATLAERVAEVGELNVQLRDARQDAARLREALEAHMQLAAKICYAEPELSQYRAMTEQAQKALKGA